MTESANKPLTFQDLILKLQEFWAEHGCVLQQPLDVEVGAGTMSPETFCACWGRSRIAWPTCSLRGVRQMAAMARIQPVVQAHAVPGDSEGSAGERAGAVSGVAEGDRH